MPRTDQVLDQLLTFILLDLDILKDRFGHLLELVVGDLLLLIDHVAHYLLRDSLFRFWVFLRRLWLKLLDVLALGFQH
jgi:hypothetical protein